MWPLFYSTSSIFLTNHSWGAIRMCTWEDRGQPGVLIFCYFTLLYIMSSAVFGVANLAVTTASAKSSNEARSRAIALYRRFQKSVN